VSQLFSQRADGILRASLVGMVVIVGMTGSAMLAVVRSPYLTDQNVTFEQPVPFSHQHHVADVGLDCRYCHQTVETSSRAGVPSTQICMNCHRDLWNQAPLLAPVRDSFRNDQPLLWNRVHDLPDYVYFNHSIHVHKGIGCFSCHGEVGEMPLTRRDQPLTMDGAWIAIAIPRIMCGLTSWSLFRNLWKSWWRSMKRKARQPQRRSQLCVKNWRSSMS
jgi:hypothetical protein